MPAAQPPTVLRASQGGLGLALRQLDDMTCQGLVRGEILHVQPMHARVRTQPLDLATRQLPGGQRDGLHGLVLAHLPIDDGERLGVSRRTGRGLRLPQANVDERAHLLDEPAVHHGARAQRDAFVELLHRATQRHHECRCHELVARHGRRIGAPGQLDDLEGADNPASVMRVNTLRRYRVQLTESIMEAPRAHRPLGFFFESGAHGLVRARKLDDVQESTLVETRPSRDHGDTPALVDTHHIGARMPLVGGHRRLVSDVEHVDLVVGDSPALLHRGLGRSHIHAAVELQGISGHDLTRARRSQRLRQNTCQLQGEVRLSRGRGPHNRAHDVRRASNRCLHGHQCTGASHRYPPTTARLNTMSTTDTPPVTLDRVIHAVEAVGLIPFVSSTGQVAAILPNRTVRIAVPEGHPVQGVADYPRFFDPSHADAIASAVRRLNASTYLPKITSGTTETGAIALHLQHTFNWVVGATDAQVQAEVSQFIMASVAMMNQLDIMFPDQWTKEAANA